MKSYIIPIFSFFTSMYLVGNYIRLFNSGDTTFGKFMLFLLFTILIGGGVGVCITIIYEILTEWKYREETFTSYIKNNYDKGFLKILIASIIIPLALFAIGNCIPLHEDIVDTHSAQDTQSSTGNTNFSWKDAYNHIGEDVTLEGKIVDSYQAAESTGSPTFLDMGASYPDDNRVTIVVWEEDLYNFDGDPETMYMNETVEVTGTLTTYDGVAQIEIESQDQIKIK